MAWHGMIWYGMVVVWYIFTLPLAAAQKGGIQVDILLDPLR